MKFPLFFCDGCETEFETIKLSLTRNPGEGDEENYCFACTDHADEHGYIVKPLHDAPGYYADANGDE